MSKLGQVDGWYKKVGGNLQAISNDDTAPIYTIIAQFSYKVKLC